MLKKANFDDRGGITKHLCGYISLGATKVKNINNRFEPKAVTVIKFSLQIQIPRLILPYA